MNSELSGISDTVNRFVDHLLKEPRAIVGFFVFLAVAMFLKWKWFYVPALTLVALAVVFHYTFDRTRAGEFSANLGFFLIGLFLAAIIGAYYLFIKQ